MRSLLAEEVISTFQLPFHRSRYRATVRLFRQLRHDLATPLSGAALHLEVACRRLSQGDELDLKRVLENIRMGQLEVGYASAMLEVLTEIVRTGEEEGADFALSAAIVDGTAQVGPDRSRGLTITTPRPDPEPAVYGSRRQMEQAVADLTFHAFQTAEPHSVVSWELADGATTATLTCRWKGKFPETRAEQVFSITRTALGESRGLGLLLARWAVECHGGDIAAEQGDGEARFVATLPLGREEHAS
jgi:signal transduction histidine kinase